MGIPFTTYTKPTFLEKIGLMKPKPQKQIMSFYVCCPTCAEKVKADPNATDYLVKVMQERMGVFPSPSAAPAEAHHH